MNETKGDFIYKYEHRNFPRENASNKKEDESNQSYFSEINFKNTNNPFVLNSLSNAKISYAKKFENENSQKTLKSGEANSIVNQFIRNIPKNPYEDDKNSKMKNASYLVEEFMNDLNKVNLFK